MKWSSLFFSSVLQCVVFWWIISSVWLGAWWQAINSGTQPPINITRLIGRIVRYGGCSPCNLVVGLGYMERLMEKQPSLQLTTRNIVKLFLIAVMTSVKFWEDEGFTNDHWATIVGLTLQVRSLLRGGHQCIPFTALSAQTECNWSTAANWPAQPGRQCQWISFPAHA